MCLILHLVAALATLAGCAPDTILPNPEGWPTELSGRKLYHTPHAYIYATCDTAAGEIDRRLADVAHDFVEMTGATVEGKPLLIVTDLGDAPLLSTAEGYYTVAARHGLDDSKDYSGVGIRLARNRQDYQRYVAKAGLQPQDGIMMIALPLATEDLCDVLGLPCEVACGAEWAVALPTDAAVGRFYGKMAGVVYSEQRLGVKILALPFLPLVNSVAHHVAQAMCRVEVFKALLDRHDEWSPETRAKHLETYRKREVRAALGALAPILMKD